MRHPRLRGLLLATAGAASLCCVLLLALRPSGSAPFSPATGKGAGKIPNDWFYIQRAYPGVTIDPSARELALEQARALRAERLSRGDGAGSNGDRLPSTGQRIGMWEEAGPVNIGGRITALAVHPSVPGRIFAGAADGGVFRSIDGGLTWVPVFDEIGSLSIGALAVDPSNPQTVYAGTGEANASGDSFAGLGLLRSLDAGDTWEHLGLGESRHINRILVDPSNSNRVYVAVMGALFTTNPERGLYRSTDGGANWERTLFVNDSTGVIDAAIDPSNPARLYAATWERIRTPRYRRAGGPGCGVHRSTDGGTTWTRLGNGLPAPSSSVGRIGLALAASQPQTVYAIYADDSGYFSGLYKTTNGGDSWTRTNDGGISDLYSSYGWYFGNVRVDPTNPNKIYPMGLDIYRSTTGGGSWSVVSWDVHVDQHDLWIDPAQPNRMIAGGDGGVYLTTSGGSSWIHVETLPITQFYAGAVDEQLPQRIYGGSQDNGTVRTQTGGLSGWDWIYDGDGFYCLVDPRNSNIIFAEYQYGGLGKSTNGGSSFNSCLSGVSSSDRRNWSTPVVMDPSNPDRMYYGTYRLYRTTNAAGSWSAISGDLTGGPGGATLVYATITTIAVAPSNSQVVYAGTDDARVWRTTNGGTSWTNLSAGLPDRWVTRVAVDRLDADRAYVAHSGYRVDDPTAHLHRTTDGGATWIPCGLGLPQAPVNALVLDPSGTGVLYAGTDVGVYVSYDDGLHWSELAGGIPVTVIHDLVLHEATRSLVAFTHGRSSYRYTLPDPTSVSEWLPGDHGSDLEGSGTSRMDPVLGPPRPNPFGDAGYPMTIIPFALRSAATQETAARVEIYDPAGRLLRTLHPASGAGRPSAAERTPAGGWSGEVRFDGRDAQGRALPSGTYYVRLVTSAGAASRALTIRR